MMQWHNTFAQIYLFNLLFIPVLYFSSNLKESFLYICLNTFACLCELYAGTILDQFIVCDQWEYLLCFIILDNIAHEILYAWLVPVLGAHMTRR